MKMYSTYIILLGLFVITVSSAKKDKYTDENRPYEFGFNIEGQQHRHEAKDADGLITGEFGFITGDGVYHVTVYATDENGAFKIVSMKSIKVSPPLDGSPDPAGTKYDRPSLPEPSLKPAPGATPSTNPPKYIVHAVKMPDTKPPSTPPPPSGVFTTAKPLPLPSCSSCGIPSTTPGPPGAKPNQFVFQTAGFQKPPNPSPNKVISQIPQKNPGVHNQPIQSKPVHNSSPLPNKQLNQTPQYTPGIFHNPAPKQPLPNNPVQNPVQNPIQHPVQNPIRHPVQNPVQNPIQNPIKNPVQNPFLSSYKQPTQVQQQNPVLPSSVPNPLNNPLSPSPISGFNKQPNPGVSNVQVPHQDLQGPRAPDEHKNTVQNTFNNPNIKNPPNPKPGDTSLTPFKPPQIPTPNAPLPILNPKPPSPQINLSNNVGLPKQPSNTPKPFFPGLIHPPSTSSAQQQHPPIDGKLPPGVTVDDMLHLLYKFNYTVGFHGHYESGFKNGAKIGGYFINGRDGISRIVEYVADENGYRPKITYINLGLDSPDTPKAETEKNYGLKGQVFEWFSL